ncbi:MAG: Stk1 family PASTA domain-containing Ser/Thr kinase [Lachnospiraceae bacterium]|jgi:serine/threonine-protein kinase|nr:Stk1 family PASTA domain-containing Ser/Thr kinase [Lachnospiraceae bacterium]
MLKEGTFIADRYEIVGKVGTGGMADVYKAKDHTLGRFVGIKVLKQEFSEDVNFVTKFRTEAQSAAGLEHPNIVNIYDVGSENAIHYIVMEYVEGITLKTYIEKKGQLSFKEAVSIAIQVGRGIEAAHNKHIIHRDIKPQNIIISTEGKVKVTDFGIARAASSNTINSDVMGSVHYASPEQARNGFVDGKSDIYSLGIVMYEMVTGRVPFDGESTVAIAIQHLQEEMVRPSAYAPDLPVSLEKIIIKCTQKSPDRRYDSIGDLLIDLKKALISPNEDFVVMVPVGQQDKTRVMKQEEVESIKEQTRNMYYEDAAEEPAKEEEQEEEEEEDDSGFLNPKMEKAVTIMGIVAAVIIVAIIIYIVGSFFGLFRFGGSDRKDKEQDKQEEIIEPEDEAEDTKDQEEQVEMIDVKGKTFEEAKDALNSIGLGIDKAGEESSDTYAQGQIVGQSVEVGVKVDKNTTILVTISSGVGEVDVPSVTGLDKETAEAKLTENGFIANVNFEYSETVANGTVISQSPEAGSKAKKGDTVTINVSRGVEPIVMINVLNKPEAEARAALSNLGLNVTTTSDYSNDVPEGNVISQSIVEGKSVEKGATVTLVISLGRKSTFYSLNNYSINKLPEIPADATSIQAVITLYRSEGEDVINTWTATSFPFSITQGNIENSSHGYIIIDWEWHYLDDEGVDVIQTQTTEIDDITFTQN